MTRIRNSNFLIHKSWMETWKSECFRRTPQLSTPVITWSAAGTTDLPATPVEYRPDICGGGSAVTGWNGQSTPTPANIRFAGGVFETTGGGSSDLCMRGSLIPGGTAQAARWPVIFDFTTTSANSVVEISFAILADTGVLVEVNGKLVADTMIRQTTATTSHNMTLTFPKAASRTIRIYTIGSACLYAVRVPSGQTISKPSNTIVSRAAFIGDSWARGSGTSELLSDGASAIETWAMRFMRLMGHDEFVNASIGGSGFTVNSSDGSEYINRATAVMATDPDVVYVYGSQNDGNNSALAAAMPDLLDELASVSRVIYFSTILPGYDTQIEAALTAFRSYATTNSKTDWHAIDMRGLFTGTGTPSAPTGTGTSDFFRKKGDTLHPSFAGHPAIADFAFEKAYRAVNGL